MEFTGSKNVPFSIIPLSNTQTLRALVITKRGREREKMEGREDGG